VHRLAPLVHWDSVVSAYLANRRSLGRAYIEDERILHSLRTHLLSAHSRDLNQRIFDKWRNSFRHLNPNTRYGYERAVYNLCRYRRRSEPRCYLPDLSSFARRQPHPLPTIIEPLQVARLLALASTLKPVGYSSLRAADLRLAVVLLYTAGLRLGELVRLTLADFDSQAGVLHIRRSKFHKSRLIPMSPSAREELCAYLKARTAHELQPKSDAPLLCRWSRGRACPYSRIGMYKALHALFDAAGLRNQAGRCPRIHDLRHSFAVAALLRWYQTGADVQVNLPKLAIYMGHVDIVSTAYYLRWMPAVVEHAGKRFEHSYAALIEGGAS
jgi:integrase/recombinase XerD